MDTLRYSAARALIRWFRYGGLLNQRALLLIGLCILLLPSVMWLVRPGFWVSGDGLHHLYRVDELARYVRGGVFLPRWFGEFSFGYGAPVFLFYNPLSYYLALPFTPIGSLAATKAAMALAALLSAGAMFAYARRHAPAPVALLAVLVYLYVPYRLVDLYVRAALAEHVAFIWFPLILLASDRIAELPTLRRVGNSAGAIAGFALAWTSLLLTHTFSAVMFAPFSAAYLLWLAWRQRNPQPLALAALGGLLAIGLSAFFWWPLLSEQVYAGLGSGAISTGYRAHLVTLRQLIGALRYDYTTGALDPNYYYAVGLAPMVLLILGLAAAAWRKWQQPAQSSAPALESQNLRRKGARGSSQSDDLGSRYGGLLNQRRAPLAAVDVALSGSGMAVTALFMCTRASQPLWDALAPLLANMQFPWRYLSIATLGISLALLALPLGQVSATVRPSWQSRAISLTIGIIVAGALMLTTLPTLPIVPLPITEADVTPESFWAFDQETGQAGSTWAGEFIPIGVTEQRWALGRSPATAQDGPAIAAPQVTLTRVRPDWIELSVDHPQAWPLRYHAFYFPGWQVRVDGAAVDTSATGDMGLVTAEVPPGRHQVQIRFEATPVRLAARWTSLTAGALLVVLLAWATRSSGRPRLGWAVLACGWLLIAAAAWGGPEPKAAALQPVAANLEQRALLIGAYPDHSRYQPGDEARITLVWLALAQVARADKSFVHLLGPDGSVIAQHDGDPGGGYTPTTRWQPGEIILDRHMLTVPADLPPGRYPLRAGLYQFDPLRNLSVDPPTSDGRVDVGALEVER